MHRKVQEGVGPAVAAVVGTRHRSRSVGQLRLVLRVLSQPLARQRFQSIQRLARSRLGMDGAEESPHFLLRRVEHGGERSTHGPVLRLSQGPRATLVHGPAELPDEAGSILNCRPERHTS